MCMVVSDTEVGMVVCQHCEDAARGSATGHELFGVKRSKQMELLELLDCLNE